MDDLVFDHNKKVCKYRGFDIYDVGNGYFGIQRYYYFKWSILQDAKNHIDRALGGRSYFIQDPIPEPVPQPSYAPSSAPKTVEIKDIYDKINIDIEKEELKNVTDGLLTLIEQCYLIDLISNKFVDDIKFRLDKLQKVIGLISSDFNNVSEIATKKSFQICKEILIDINKEAKIK